jgi:DNA-directed RNA polymerase II subunit RPB1
MWEINNTLGIEAVRKFLINEFNEIITSGGINVDKVHLELLADSMTCTGSITSVSRYGIGRNETGPLTKASFEQSLDNMLKTNVKAKRVIKSYISENKLSKKELESTLEYLVDKF